ncbi:MAG: PAS domain S-box protein [Desulfobulbaceae bacterium]|nr:PAS domain S-box protein [Desulfobulbaceae bacterium]
MSAGLAINPPYPAAALCFTDGVCPSETPCRSLTNAVIQSMADAMFVVDSRLRITTINPALSRLWGYTIDEVRGKPIQMLVAPVQDCHQDRLPGDFENALEQARLFAIPYRRKDGTSFLGETHSSPVRDDNDNIIGLVCITRDVSAERQAAESLRRAYRQLKEKLTERTAELEERNAATNTALDVLLKKREEETKTVTENLLIRLKELMEPPLQGLKTTALTTSQRRCIADMETILVEILSSPLDRTLSSRIHSLSPAETKVARLVIQGKSTKEIAQWLNLSPWTVDVHRKNIRKKCGITNQKANLRTILSTYLK